MLLTSNELIINQTKLIRSQITRQLVRKYCVSSVDAIIVLEMWRKNETLEKYLN